MPDNTPIIPTPGAEATAREFEAQIRQQDAELAVAVQEKQAREDRAAAAQAKIERENAAIFDIGGQNRP